MKKDIPVKKVTDIAIAIVPGDESLWDVFIVNMKNEAIRNVLITSRGYGERQGERVETTRLRYFYDSVGALQAEPIEPIQTDLFDLAHEYWISFQCDDFLYDKKYVFVQGSISEDYLRMIPILNKKGIMIV